MSYQFLPTGQLQRVEDTAYIPIDPRNRDYQDYLAWVALGNTAAQLLAPVPSLDDQLRASDMAMPSVADAVIGLLITKGLIKTTDLPVDVQTIIQQRAALEGLKTKQIKVV